MKAKSVMIQGTASSVGKSLITTGLCRIFKQDGFRTAPFKSQNIALNSYVTKDGKEMGRAQVVQAEAAGIEPSVEMNPILLKFSGGSKIQVVLKGEVFGNLSGDEYYNMKPRLAEIIADEYGKLAAKNDILVIEGAGSPAEINMRGRDIVNMGVAEIADAPVILVGDIDKGGVFASLAGTMLLLSEQEKQRVKGVIINKFRGDLNILKPGLDKLEEIIKVPVLGVLPYMEVNIEDEDSAAERLDRRMTYTGAEVDIAIIKLPYMSNFTDFSALDNIEGVRVRYVDRVTELMEPDLIIIPGTKNTIEDLLFIRNTGVEEAIKRLNSKRIPVFGICGGYQMLGRKIQDPYHVETDLEGIDGMGLLNNSTILTQAKVTTRTEGVITDDDGFLKELDGTGFTGYEIHMGITGIEEGCIPFLKTDSRLPEVDSTVVGVRNGAGTVYGTYIHGIFNNSGLAYGLTNNLRAKKGMLPAIETKLKYKEFKEAQYDQLADTMRDNLDMKRIYEIMSSK